MVNIHVPKTRDVDSFFNGTFRESFNALATSDGATVTLTITNAVSGDLIMQFSDGDFVLDCTSAPCTLALTAGTDASPQSNYIYIPITTKVLTKSTTEFPTGAEHIKVGYFLVPSEAEVQTRGVYINQNWNDHLENSDNQGHMSHMAERSRRDGAYYFSGVTANGTDQDTNTSYFDFVSGTEAYFKSASGVIFQMHRHAYGAKDTRTNTIHVVNWNGDSYHNINDMTDITNDANGNTLTNKFFNLTFFGVANKGGEYGPVMCNLPTGSYNTQSSAENDVDGFDVLSMPREFNLESSTGFLICRMTMRKVGGNWSHISTVDLRGQTPQTASGGASGTTTSFADNQFEVFNVTDNTKLLNFDISTVTTGNTRILSIPDGDGTLGLFDGLAGGQTLIGGTASGENLTLQSTSHATRGKILFGTSGYDEVNNRLGIGTSTPSDKLQVVGGSIRIDTGQTVRASSSSFDSLGLSSGLVGLNSNKDIFLKIDKNNDGTDARVGITKNNGALGSADEIFTFLETGRLGINKITPGSFFHSYINTATTTKENMLILEQDGSGDVGITFALTGGIDWHQGIDNTQADSYNIAIADIDAANLLSSSVFRLSTTGNLTLNPAGFTNGGALIQSAKQTGAGVFDIFTASLSIGGASGSVGDGFNYNFQIENDAGALHDAGRFSYVWSDPSAGTEESKFTINTMVAGSFVDALTITGNVSAFVGSLSAASLSLTTDLAITHGGTGQSTAQLAINALSAVSGATNEHVLTKDTGTGNAIWKAGAGGHTRLHSMTDVLDHSAGNHKVFYSDGSGEIQELTHGTDTHVLTSNGATSAPSWQVGGGGSPEDMAAFHAFKTTNQTFTTVADIITWIAGDVTNGAFTWNESTGILTINDAGLYLIQFDVSVTATSGTDRTQSHVHMQYDSGAGFATVPGTNRLLYQRTATFGGASGSITHIVDAGAGDELKFQITRASGTTTVAVDNCSLSLVQLKGTKGDAGTGTGAGGNNTEIQYNSGGSLAGFGSYNSGTDVVSFPGDLNFTESGTKYIRSTVSNTDLYCTVNDGGVTKTSWWVDASDNAKLKVPYLDVTTSLYANGTVGLTTTVCSGDCSGAPPYVSDKPKNTIRRMINLIKSIFRLKDDTAHACDCCLLTFKKGILTGKVGDNCDGVPE